MAQRNEVRRLRRGVVLLGAAGLFFLVSAGLHFTRAGSFRGIDIVVPLWALLFAAYWRRWRRAESGDE